MKKFKLILIGIILIAFFQLYNYLFKNIEIKTKNENFIKDIMKVSNSHLVNEKQNKNLVYEFVSLVTDINVNNPVTLLENNFDYNYIDKMIFSYITNDIMDKPVVYIYSSHPGELYSSKILEGYDIEPGVILASILLQEKLTSLGIQTIVEQRNVSTYLKERGLNFNDSYTASRVFVKDILKEHPNLDLIIDLHRDATTKEVTTTTINGKDYARVMFVQNTTLKDNLNLATSLNKIFDDKYPNLSRGIYTKHKSSFNQDLNPNIVLLELGGNYNTIEEVVNTIDAISEVIKEKLK